MVSPRITAELAERYQIVLKQKAVAQRMWLLGMGDSSCAFAPVTMIKSKRKSRLTDLVKRMCDIG
ncbi:hypothetical protein D8M20_02640 [Corynebacterium propinquum]|uniref:hypothetical protein n=1 Tax=Corynebacterium propinquum TaxID=43769 RepID=UPI000F88860A|nr:hypothetical protein [Corynebacterium propinquum]MCT1819510.1 hypothetical protein [Corynebacterium propinquum]MDK4240073.1 hypothetical protein [Corynebacterium propinquum]RUP80086.1 hypothetical protein D8M24_00020 [Corynebacterium propinquum]RUP90314.1 hypothetical protein D8M40_00020 [Corynebacterium propinquum]RUP97307.1 hypothetical protein D8M20_02640 [Corynebacterium propinquum]